MSNPVFRYTYTSKRNGARYTARVTIYQRIENEGIVLLMLQPIGRWPDREDLAELADEAESRGVPMVNAILLTSETETEWVKENLRPEAEEWAA